MKELAFRTLLYRYFFFGWLFRDVNRGTLFERQASWVHNKAQARWLPTYLRRWLVMGTTLFVAGFAVELALNAPVVAAAFYLPAAISVPVDTVIGAAWIGLRTLARPL